MRRKYDFSQSEKNPYAKHLKQQVTMLMDKEVVEYFSVDRQWLLEPSRQKR